MSWGNWFIHAIRKHRERDDNKEVGVSVLSVLCVVLTVSSLCILIFFMFSFSLSAHTSLEILNLLFIVETVVLFKHLAAVLTDLEKPKGFLFFIRVDFYCKANGRGCPARKFN